MAELAAANLGRGVIGWDLAAEEGPHPMAKHEAGLRRAVELGVPCTAHAGEWGSGPQTTANPCVVAWLSVYVCAHRHMRVLHRVWAND